jgi:hypothetical protein
LPTRSTVPDKSDVALAPAADARDFDLMPRAPRPPFVPAVADEAIGLVERAFAVGRADIVGEYRKAEMVEARHVVVWLLREATDAQHITIATCLNRRTHVMSVQGFWRVQERRKRDVAFRATTDRLLTEFRATVGACVGSRPAGRPTLRSETA